mgnify:CR=1 FL=1
MAVRVPWDHYEAALLLDYCIRVENNELSRIEAISIVSQLLRQRAINKGLDIDDVFRNENGISMQFSAMRNCYLGKKQGLTISKLFYEVVRLQKDCNEEFQQLLQERLQIMNTSTWQGFLLWLSERYPAKEKETLRSLILVNVLGRKSRVMKEPLGDICNSSKIEELEKTINSASSFGFQSKKNVVSVKHALHLYAEYLDEMKLTASDKEQEGVVSRDTIDDNDSIFTVDFRNALNYSHTKPVSCSYKGQLIKKNGWNAVFHALVQAVYQNYKDIFPVGQSLSASSRIDTGSSEEMIYPKEIADGIFLECNVNATGVVNKLRALMDYCKIDYSDIEIQYRSSEKHSDKKTHSEKITKPQWTPQFIEEVTRILSVKYKYGFRIGSPIEMMKIRNYAEAENLKLPLSDEELEKEILAAGVTIDGKVYVLRKELLEGLAAIIDEIFETGVVVIFLSSFAEKQSEWLEEHHITSETLLKEVLKRCKPSLYCGQNIITQGVRMTEHEAVVSEIHRVAGSDAIVWVTDLEEQLIYVPSEKIAWSLSASDEFVWISEGKYFRVSHFIYSDSEAENILSYVAEECESKGYASITDVPMGSIPEENYELSITALYSSIFNAILKEHYYLNGKILTKDQNGIDISVLLKAYCQDREECTVKEVMERAEELTGNINKQYSIIALYDTLIRADADRFVSEKSVNFNVDRIDKVLEEIIGNRFAPIRKVSTFALFPTCGINWNHYLLESFCYRFSKKYRLSVLNYNDKNAGIIAAIDLPLTYNEMLCEAAAMSDIDLEPEAVGEYLFTNGFTAKRKYSSMPEIIEKANIIREER